MFASDMLELDACTLLCHCEKHQQCHGDVLVRKFAEERSRLTNPALLQRVTDGQALEEAARRKMVAQANGTARKHLPPHSPSRTLGTGPPITVRSRGVTRLLCDGGGLCSPGLWPPERRLEWKI